MVSLQIRVCLKTGDVPASRQLSFPSSFFFTFSHSRIPQFLSRSLENFRVTRVQTGRIQTRGNVGVTRVLSEGTRNTMRNKRCGIVSWISFLLFLLGYVDVRDTTVREIREGKTANVPETREKLRSAKLTIRGGFRVSRATRPRRYLSDTLSAAGFSLSRWRRYTGRWR